MIALIVTTLGGGGTERFVIDLAVELAGRGLKPIVIADSAPLDRLPILSKAGIPVSVLGADETWDRSRYCAEITSVLIRSNIKLAHVNAWVRIEWISGALKALGIPAVLSIHGTVPVPRLRDWIGLNRVPFYLYRDRAEVRRIALPVISISERSAFNLGVRYRGSVPTKVVYCGVPEPPVIAGDTGDSATNQIVWVGSMIPRKRPLLAIKVLSRLRARGINCRLVMLGDGPLMPIVKATAARLPSGTIELPGSVTDIGPYLRSSHVFFHCASNEGIPYSILEAMSYSLPVVAVDTGAISEAVIHNTTGILSRSSSPAQLTTALESLLRSRSIQRNFGSAGFNLFRRSFTLSRMVDETITAYDTLVGVHP